MTALYEEVPFSELLHHPAATTDRLNSVRALRLRRRDADDLALVRIDQLEQEGVVFHLTAGLLASLVRTGNRAILREVVLDAVPWTTFLPEEDLETFLSELVSVARGAAEFDNMAPVALLLTQWRHTAEVYADPALLRILTSEVEGDLGPVPVPGEDEPSY
jgi:hypothetical protein